MALLLDQAAIRGLLDMEQAIDLMERAFAELANGTAALPQRQVIADAEHAGWAGFMPAHLRGMGALGIKAVTVFQRNPSAYGLPGVMATILLLDQETGKALAVMDGTYITAMRTGAASGLATRLLARPTARVAGVLGTGVQARTQLWAICTVRPIQRVVCYSTSSNERKKSFVEEMSRQLGIPVETAETARQVAEDADVLALATTAVHPVVRGDWLRPGTHINAIGAHTPSARELDTGAVLRAKVVCDLTSACMAEAGDLIIALREGAFSQNKVHADLGELVTGRKRGRENDQEITLFKSVGLSIQDIATAHFVYNRALEIGGGVPFEF